MRCALIRRAYDLKKIVKKVAEIYGIKMGEVLARGRQRAWCPESLLFLVITAEGEIGCN